MQNHINILKLFSENPITVFDIQRDSGVDIGSKEFLDSFQYLEVENLIQPLSDDTYGLTLASRGGIPVAVWSEVKLVITKEGKYRLNPPKPEHLKFFNWLGMPLIVASCKFILLGLLAIIGGVYSSDIKDMIREHLGKTQPQTQEPSKQKTNVSQSLETPIN